MLRITFAVTVCMFCIPMLHAATAEHGSFRVEASESGKTCAVYAGDIRLALFTSVLISKGRLLQPDAFHAERTEDGLRISGNFSDAAFSGWFILGDKGIIFVFRCYAGRKESDMFGIRLEAGPDTFKNGRQGVYSSRGYSLVLNSPATFRTEGHAVVNLSPFHFTGGEEGGVIWGGITKDTYKLPVLIRKPDIGRRHIKNIPFTFRADIIDSIDNPYTYQNTVCTFTSPSGRKTRVQPFFTQDFTAGNNTVSEKGCPYFAFRFCPREQGRYLYEISTGKRSPVIGRFNATNSDKDGFILGGTGSRFFRYENGGVYFPVGLNVAWANDMIGYLDTCAANGINFIRLWLCTWGLNLEGKNLYDYRLDMCRQLDEIFMHARDKDIKIMLCINNFHDFRNNKDRHGYFDEAGPCREDKDFFTDPRCLSVRKDFYRYLVNRYSAYPSLLCWELWNEVDYAVSYPEVNIAASQDAMAGFLKNIDPFKHPVTTSLGWNSIDYDLWDKKSIDIVQFHSYVPEYTILPKYSDYMDIALHIKKNILDFSRYSKPILISEIGHNGTNDNNLNNDLDAEGVMLHNSLWASSMSGFAGSAMHWWWDVYIDKNNLYYHFLPLARALAGFTVTPETVPVSSERIYKGQIRIMGLKNRAGCMLWIQDKKATWSAIHLKSYVPVRFTAVKVRIGRFDEGRYRVRWINTFSGETIRVDRVQTIKRMIRLDVPPFTRDTACVVRRSGGQ